MSLLDSQFDPAKTLTDGYVSAHGIAGKEMLYDDRNPSDLSKRRSNKPRRMRLVKNDSGGALLPNLVLKADTTSATTFLQEAAGVAGASDIPVGVVNDLLPSAGVANGAWFWMVVEGPNLVTSSAAVTAGAIVATATGGKSADASSPPTDNDFGRAMEAASGADEDKLVFINLP